MVKAARARTYVNEHEAYFTAFGFARNVQSVANALRRTIGLRPIRQRYGVFFATNAY